MFFVQTYYFFIVSGLAFLAGASYCFAATSDAIWPKGIVLPLVGAAFLAQSIYIPIPGTDVLLIEAIALCTMTGSALGLSGRLLRRRMQRRAARRMQFAEPRLV
ncbi:hypothetical protein [Pseudooceanicola nitratireducens]|jgi:hypothetical protein|uniref:hypothetical protein n=1 Tax=Pseudooceanicola nitratireducens TaxID=517719 RepID=UPI001C97F09B|nr:hypothetical protein [Pseudooceanicola nitratireducens]MBY6156659.1 hypothetical protein [Pseudooceanicola nitratireducens]MBY6166536.1 hypothetical protein [Pseudooceanicola nitratireducens]MEC7297990.1 hypothetical protein [Pseudomonadota bacterium]MEC8666694.1 hypothetical protein [Pseudomonadota bacterium]